MTRLVAAAALLVLALPAQAHADTCGLKPFVASATNTYVSTQRRTNRYSWKVTFDGTILEMDGKAFDDWASDYGRLRMRVIGCKGSLVSGKILLLFDGYEPGSTLPRCKRLEKEKGASAVIIENGRPVEFWPGGPGCSAASRPWALRPPKPHDFPWKVSVTAAQFRWVEKPGASEDAPASTTASQSPSPTNDVHALARDVSSAAKDAIEDAGKGLDKPIYESSGGAADRVARVTPKAPDLDDLEAEDPESEDDPGSEDGLEAGDDLASKKDREGKDDRQSEESRMRTARAVTAAIAHARVAFTFTPSAIPTPAPLRPGQRVDVRPLLWPTCSADCASTLTASVHMWDHHASTLAGYAGPPTFVPGVCSHKDAFAADFAEKLKWLYSSLQIARSYVETRRDGCDAPLVQAHIYLTEFQGSFESMARTRLPNEASVGAGGIPTGGEYEHPFPWAYSMGAPMWPETWAASGKTAVDENCSKICTELQKFETCGPGPVWTVK